MILHVVGGKTFVSELARKVEHEEFFIDRILNTNVAPVYSFDATSQTKAQLERIATGEIGFEEGAQALSREFSRLHVNSSRDGALFVFELTTDEPDTKIYSLIKYDYSEAIEQADNDGISILRRIVHAFIADKKAIQKSAMVRIRNGIADLAISATDRVKQAPNIGDYFATFLHVERERSDQELNQKLVDAVRDTLSACRDHLPDRDVARAFKHAKSALRDRQQITEEAISEAIFAAAGNPDSEKAKEDLKKWTAKKIKSAKLEGLAFKPDPKILQRPPMRRLQTAEGIVLTYPDDADGITVKRQQKKDGGELITIHTKKVTEDRFVNVKPIGAA